MSANDNEKLASEARRLLLKSLAAGGAAAALLPEKWTKPVIDKILVPAHAQGSLSLYGIYTNEILSNLTSNYQSDSLFERLANMVIPVAYAQNGNGSSYCNSLCIALDVKTDNSVIGYVAGSQGKSIFDPGNRSIANFYVNTCGRYYLSNCVINAGGSQLTGHIESQSNNCYSRYFTLARSNAIPYNCNNCSVGG